MAYALIQAVNLSLITVLIGRAFSNSVSQHGPPLTFSVVHVVADASNQAECKTIKSIAAPALASAKLLSIQVVSSLLKYADLGSAVVLSAFSFAHPSMQIAPK